MTTTRGLDERPFARAEASGSSVLPIGDTVLAERRAITRQALPNPIAARVKGTVFARVLDLSDRGALAETSTPLRPKAKHELVIAFPDAPFVAQATVHRCRAWGYGLDPVGRRVLLFRSGFEFDALPPAAIELLEYNLFLLCDAGARGLPESIPGEADRNRLLHERRLARKGGPIRIRVRTGCALPGR